jgi:hypothetical protein
MNTHHRTYRRGTSIILGIALSFFMLAIIGCEGPVHPNYFDDPSLDPFPTGGEPPVIATVSPDRGFAGDELVITGGPFPLQMDRILVNVGNRAATILAATESELRVRLPNNEPGSRRVRVSVWGAEEWSNELSYTYLQDYVEMDFGIATPRGVAVDSDGNLYIGSAHEQTIYRIDFADSTRTAFASVPVSGPMEFGPDGYLYVVTSSGLSRVSPGGALESVVEITNLSDFDWGPDGRIYLLQPNQVRLFDGSTHEQVTAVLQGQRIRVFDGFVYVTELSRARIVRFRIEGSTLGPLQVHFLGGTPLMGLDIDRTGATYASAFVRDYIMKAAADRESDADITEIPDATQRNNPFRRISTRISEVHIHNSVMYVVQDVPAGTPGKVWRIFIDERNAPRFGRDS